MEDDVIDVSRIRPIGDKLLVRKCCRGDEGLIVTPDAYKDHSEFVEIIAVGPKCKHFAGDHAGKSVKCPELSDGMHHLDGEFWFVREEVLMPVLFD